MADQIVISVLCGTNKVNHRIAGRNIGITHEVLQNIRTVHRNNVSKPVLNKLIRCLLKARCSYFSRLLCVHVVGGNVGFVVFGLDFCFIIPHVKYSALTINCSTEYLNGLSKFDIIFGVSLLLHLKVHIRWFHWKWNY